MGKKLHNSIILTAVANGDIMRKKKVVIMERFMVSTTAPVQHLSWVAVEREKGHVVNFSSGRQWDTLVVVAEGSLSYRPCDAADDEAFDSGPNGGRIKAEKGDCVFFPRDTKNICTYMGSYNKIISVQMQAAEKTIFFTNRPYLFQNAVSNGEVQNVINSVFSCGDKEPQALSLFLTAQFYMLLYYLKCSVLNSERGTENRQDYLRLKPAIDDMQMNFHKNRKVKEFAAMVNMCESGFRKLFLRYMGQSPIAFRNAVRMQKARDLLSSGEFSVTQAAHMVGIHNLSFFCREYKKFFGTCAVRSLSK